MIREYKTIQEIASPLMVVRQVEGVLSLIHISEPTRH